MEVFDVHGQLTLLFVLLKVVFVGKVEQIRAEEARQVWGEGKVVCEELLLC